jgi:hypothetical protein
MAKHSVAMAAASYCLFSDLVLWPVVLGSENILALLFPKTALPKLPSPITLVACAHIVSFP